MDEFGRTLPISDRIGAGSDNYGPRGGGGGYGEGKSHRKHLWLAHTPTCLGYHKSIGALSLFPAFISPIE